MQEIKIWLYYQMDHPIPVRPGVDWYEKNMSFSRCCCTSGSQNENERKQKG